MKPVQTYEARLRAFFGEAHKLKALTTHKRINAKTIKEALRHRDMESKLRNLLFWY